MKRDPMKNWTLIFQALELKYTSYPYPLRKNHLHNSTHSRCIHISFYGHGFTGVPSFYFLLKLFVEILAKHQPF